MTQYVYCGIFEIHGRFIFWRVNKFQLDDIQYWFYSILDLLN